MDSFVLHSSKRVFCVLFSRMNTVVYTGRRINFDSAQNEMSEIILMARNPPPLSPTKHLINDWLGEHYWSNIFRPQKSFWCCWSWNTSAKIGFIWLMRQIPSLFILFKLISVYRGWVENVKSPFSQKQCTSGIRTGTGSVLYIYKRRATSFANGHRCTLMILLPIQSVKKLEVGEPRLQISAGDFNVWCIDNNMGVHFNNKRTQYWVGKRTQEFRHINWQKFDFGPTYWFDISKL